MLKKDLGAIFSNKLTYVCIFLLYAFFMINTRNVWGYGYLSGIIYMANSNNIDIIALLMVLPASFLICDEYRYHNVMMHITRTSPRNYIVGKLFAGWISGFIMCLLAYLFFILTMGIMSKEAIDIVADSYSFGIRERLHEHHLDLLAHLLQISLISCYAGNWPMIGIALSAVFKNRQLVLFLPYIILQLSQVMINHLGWYQLADGNFSTMQFYTGNNEILYQTSYSLFWFLLSYCILRVGLKKKQNSGIW